MILTSLNPKNSQSFSNNKDVLSVFREQPYNKIEEGMTPQEIAEIASEHFIAIVRQQFEEVKKNYQDKACKDTYESLKNLE